MRHLLRGARVAPLLLAFLLVAPLAAAHLSHRRGSIQLSEGERSLSVEASGTSVAVNLTLLADIERDAVSHVIDPKQGLVAVSYRAAPPVAASRFEQRWTIDRVLEYHDANENGRYEPNVDGAVRSWRLSNYAWSAPTIRDGTVGNIAVKSIAWVGTLQGGPNVTMELAVAGKPLTDEGANARSQDVIVYLTLSKFPSRAIGDLYVLESTLSILGAANVTEQRTQNLTTNVRVMQDNRAGFIDWGATAVTDGAETNALLALGDPTLEDGVESRTLRLDFARFDRTLRLVIVSGVEYDNSALQKTPGETVPALVAIVLLAAAFRRRV